MFDKITTKNLKIAKIQKYFEGENHWQNKEDYYYKETPRFALVRSYPSYDSNVYEDVLTETRYITSKHYVHQGEEVISSLESLIFPKTKITRDEANELLKKLNQNYLVENESINKKGKYISTKNLKIAEINNVSKIDKYKSRNEKYKFKDNPRYALVKPTESYVRDEYIDVFTKTIYKSTNYDLGYIYDDKGNCTYDYKTFEVGTELITNLDSVITNKDYISKEEAWYILENQNPTYLEENPKTLRKTKK